MITRRHLVGLAAASALAPAVSPQSPMRKAWPNRIVRLVVPFAPGGGTDAVARILSTRLSEIWGQQMVIENRGGAGSNIGVETVARAEPDGYTILIASLPIAVNRYIYPSLNYDPIADFAPVIADLPVYPNLMVVPNSSPAKSVKEFIAHAKANRGKITFASSGTGTSPHLSGELFKRRAGIEMTHIPYRGVAPALNDVIPGRVDVMFNTMAGVLQAARAGQLRGLAVTSAERFPTAPEFPTVAESGVPGFDVVVLVRAVRAGQDAARHRPARSTPTPRRSWPSPPSRSAWSRSASQVVASTPAELGAQLKSESELWGPSSRPPASRARIERPCSDRRHALTRHWPPRSALAPALGAQRLASAQARIGRTATCGWWCRSRPAAASTRSAASSAPAVGDLGPAGRGREQARRRRQYRRSSSSRARRRTATPC